VSPLRLARRSCFAELVRAGIVLVQESHKRSVLYFIHSRLRKSVRGDATQSEVPQMVGAAVVDLQDSTMRAVV
jgi:hypothetical protein